MTWTTPPTPQQVRAARALLRWQQASLAQAARVSRPTIERYEREDRTPSLHTLECLREALERAGIQLIGSTGVDRPGG